MDQPHKHATLDAYILNGTFTCSAIEVDEDTHGMGAALEACHETLKGRRIETNALVEVVQRAKAAHKYRDRRLDGDVRAFELGLLAIVGKERSDPRYQRYFPSGLRAITEAEPRALEPALVAVLVQNLTADAGKPTMKPLADAFIPRFNAQLAAEKTALDALTAAEKSLAYLLDQTIPADMAKWIEERSKLHGAVQTRFPTDKARVESYFARFAKDPAPRAAPEPVPTQPVPTKPV